MGTPNKYKSEYCKVAENILATGKSLAAICAELDITRTTLYAWRDNNLEFSEAIEKGLQKAQTYWESLGANGISGDIKNFGAAPWIFTMKNRFRADYQDDKKDEKNNESSVLEKILNGEITVNK